MCLGKVYIDKKGKAEPFMEDLAYLQVEDGRLLLKTLFKEEKRLSARIKNIDFSTSKVILEAID